VGHPRLEDWLSDCVFILPPLIKLIDYIDNNLCGCCGVFGVLETSVALRDGSLSRTNLHVSAKHFRKDKL